MDTYTRDAYTKAEREAAAFLFGAIGATPGVTAFIGHPMASTFGASLQFDEAPREYGVQFQTVRRLQTVALYASLRITCPTRGAVAEKLSAALAAFPFCRTPGNVLVQLRVRDDGLQAIQHATVTLRSPDTGTDTQVDAYTVDLGLDAVFALRPIE